MRTYLLTFAALLGLTGLTFGLSFLQLGPWGVAIAISIALVKAVLVALFFMHLVEQQTSARFTVLAAALLAATLITLAALDTASRPLLEATEVGAVGAQERGTAPPSPDPDWNRPPGGSP